MRVIFWDVDGVLNNPPVWGRRPSIDALDDTCVVRAAQLVKDTKAKCVLSSTWRHGHGLAATVSALSRHGWLSAALETPWLASVEATRGDEIRRWLAHHHVHSFVIIDDDADMGGLLPRLIQTDYRVGLTDEDCQRAAALF